MIVSKEKLLFAPFVLLEDNLRQLVRELNTIARVVSITAKCLDEVDRRFNNVDELLRYDNAERRRIQTLFIAGRSEDNAIRAYLWLRVSLAATVSCNLEGEEEVVLRFWGNWMDRIEAIKPWYAPLIRLNFPVWLSSIYVLCGITHLIIMKVPIGPFPGFSAFFRWEAVPSFIQGMIPYVVGLCLNRIRDRVFPPAVFAIGAGLNMHQRLEVWRGGFLLSLAASLIASILFTLWPLLLP